MIKKFCFIILTSVFLFGCSNISHHGMNGVYGSTDVKSGPRIHGDERSKEQRYKDCLSQSKNSKRKSEKIRCHDDSQHPEPGYWGVSFPITF
ncbi:hypothetical protein VPR01S_05_01420 [Vibrio proteolyticus NBRC 13287]|uniref:Lipoprotein n=1 Tax=Vibrio proteolyticus NBRC 13287 TaxID=1219065 RepID=U3A0K2_VIBPR|nr:hypothetical protein VPR01S_05_01420 [Vibrio proteolyticus NBRC 13287]